jgi:lysophospholipase L1-like esterase
MDLLNKIKKHISSDKTYRIAFFGDSITSTEWIHPNWREIFEYVLKKELKKITKNWKLPPWNIRCFNCGFDGATTKDALDLLDEHVFKLKPHLVICILGINDMFLGLTIKEHKNNSDKVIV